MIVLRSSKTAPTLHVDAEVPFACVKHGEYHPLSDICMEAYRNWSRHYAHLPDDKFRAAYQAAVEMRMLDRWIEDGEI